MSTRPAVGQIDPNCPTASWWLDIYGSLSIPLKSFVPHIASTPVADPAPKRYYLIDLSRLTKDQIEKIGRVMSSEFNVPLEDVMEGIYGEHGVPVLAEHLTSVDGHPIYFL
jgi:hypothetical protein